MFAIYKYCIPQPDFFSDSHSYILAACKDLEVYYRPSGYVHFLQFVHDISISDTWLVFVQYILITLSGLFLYFTISFLLGIKRKWVAASMVILAVCNPLYLVLANQVASDSTFTAFSLLWVSCIVWIVKKGNWWSAIIQVLCLWLCFQTRYNAMLYIAVLAIALLLARQQKVWYRALVVLVSVLVIWGSYAATKKEIEEETGAAVFEGLGSWMLADIALIIYPHCDNKDPDTENEPEINKLNQFVVTYKDSISAESKDIIAKNDLHWVYLWDKQSPLKRYLFNYVQEYKFPYLASWYRVAPTYKAWAEAIILQNPKAYFAHYLVPNTKLFFMPLKYEMTSYLDNGITDVPKETQEWFGWGNNRLTWRYRDIQSTITAMSLPLYIIAMAVSLIICIIYIGLDKKRNVFSLFDNVFFTYAAFWAISAVFNVVAGPIVLRYQIALFAISLLFDFYFIDRLLCLKPKLIGKKIEP
ncbi:MAG: glycosyltransferase family 39 protein [Edaphocola sp.]